MDSKTRVLMALSCEKPDRVPFNFWMDRRLMSQYEEKIGHRHWRVTHFGADVIETFPNLSWPTGPMENRNGSDWLTGPCFDDWSQVDSMLLLPDPNNEQVYSLIAEDLHEFPDKAVLLDMQTGWGIIAGCMRGYEHVYLDMYEHQEEFKKLCQRILDIQKVVVERACQMGITSLYLMEDLATTKGLSISPAMMEEFIFSYVRELIEIAKSYEIPVLWHSDGCIEELVPHLLELGVSAVNPLQPNVNDTKAFMDRFSNKMAVYGGLDNCFVIPEGTPTQVSQHVLDQFDTLGCSTGGLIFSTHDIPLITPCENVDAMVDTIKQCVY